MPGRSCPTTVIASDPPAHSAAGSWISAQPAAPGLSRRGCRLADDQSGPGRPFATRRRSRLPPVTTSARRVHRGQGPDLRDGHRAQPIQQGGRSAARHQAPCTRSGHTPPSSRYTPARVVAVPATPIQVPDGREVHRRGLQQAVDEAFAASGLPRRGLDFRNRSVSRTEPMSSEIAEPHLTASRPDDELGGSAPDVDHQHGLRRRAGPG